MGKFANIDTLTDFAQKIKETFMIKDKTEAQALVLSSTYPNCVYYTSDTHCIMIGGNIYGRGQQLSSVFRFIPVSETPGHGDFTDTSVIYVQPDGTNFILWWYSPSNTWAQTGSIAFDIATSASDISYDLTPTPDLGDGDVQSAIEALDGKVEAVDARIDDEKVEFIKERFPSKNVSNYTRHTVNYKFEWVNGQAVYTANTSYRVGYYSKLVPKGSLCQLSLYYTSAPSTWGGLSMWGYSTTNIDDYIAENGSIVGLPTIRIKHIHGNGWIRDAFFIMPEDGYLIYAYQNSYSPTIGTSLIYDVNDLTDLYTEYYKKGVADGAGMASIVGLGYNIYDYITGAVNMEGFEYGCEIHKSTPSISGNCEALYKSNTSFVYFPRMDMTGVTRLYSLVQYCTNMIVFPETTFNGSINAQNMFSGCTKLKRVGKLNGLIVEVGLYMFAGCVALERIEEVDISDMVMTTHKLTTNMFRSNSSTGSGTSVLSNLRYILLKGIGTLSSVTAYWFGNPQHWGVNTTAIPDAKQSLIDSLYTYSFDRKTAEYADCTIHLHSNTYNQLTTEEKEQITAKGYVLTTS